MFHIYIYIVIHQVLTVVVHISEYVHGNFLRKPNSDEEAFKFGLFNYILAACGAATGYMQLKFNVISNLEVKKTLEEATSKNRWFTDLLCDYVYEYMNMYICIHGLGMI